jgi:hypothetical protein
MNFGASRRVVYEYTARYYLAALALIAVVTEWI